MDARWSLPFALLIGACRSPTQITVDVQTDVPCSAVTTTSFTSGVLGAIESAPPTTETTSCEGGHIGSVVLVPSGSDTAEVGFKVVTALNGSTIDLCSSAAAANDSSCIVSRRALRYLPHTPLRVIVDMTQACEGQVCDADSTCVSGVCVNATIGDPSQCEGSGCGVGVLGSVDGGTTPPSDAGLDATLIDSGPAVDAASGSGEAGQDSAAPPFEAGVFSPASDCDIGGTLAGAAWPQEGCCPTRRYRGNYRVSTDPGVTLHGPYAVEGTPVTAPLVAADGTLVIGGGLDSNTITALNADGTLKWRYTDDAGTEAFYAMPALASDGTVHAYSKSGDYPYVTLDLATGAQVARVPFSAALNDGPALVTGGTQYMVDDETSALEARTAAGALLWSGPVGINVAVAHDHTVVTASGNDQGTAGFAWALFPDGGQRWTVQIGTDPSVQGIAIGIDDSVRGFTYDSNALFSLTLEAGAPSWTTAWDSGTPGEINGFAVADDGTTFVGTQHEGVVRVDTSGNPGASFGQRCGQPMIDAAGNVVAWCDGAISCVPPDLGTPYWSVAVPSGGQGSSPIVQQTPVVGPSGIVYYTLQTSGLPDGGTSYAIYAIGP
jgi:outer membrane protein assembly factor BamB